jgi:hypothetical protein
MEGMEAEVTAMVYLEMARRRTCMHGLPMWTAVEARGNVAGRRHKQLSGSRN